MSEVQKNIIKNKLKQSFWIVVLIAIISFVCLWYFSEKYSNSLDDEYSLNQIQTHLVEKTKKLNILLNDLDITEKASDISLNSLLGIKSQIGCELFFIKGDSVQFWTTNLISIEGLGTEFINGNQYSGFTPYIDSLISNSLYWENFVSNSGRTFNR